MLVQLEKVFSGWVAKAFAYSLKRWATLKHYLRVQVLSIGDSFSQAQHAIMHKLYQPATSTHYLNNYNSEKATALGYTRFYLFYDWLVNEWKTS